MSARTLGHDGALATTTRADVIWVFRRRRREWLEQWRRGEASSEFFYGLPTLRDRYRVAFVEDERRDGAVRLWYPFERFIAGRIGMGFALDLALRHARTLNSARAVVSTVDTCGLPLALLKKVGLLRPPLIYISQGLSDRIVAYGPDRPLAQFYRRLLLGVDELVTLSDGASVALAAWLGVPAKRVKVLPFGVDCDFWTNSGAARLGSDKILSVGSDPGRDYPTLLAAVGELPLHIVTSLPIDVARYARIVKTTRHTAPELRELYSAARFTVIPLSDRSQPSGQSAALQAMACGQTVVLTRTRGWWGETRLVDGENCVVVPPGDADALAGAMHRLWEDPGRCGRIGRAARATVIEHFSERRMAVELAAVIEARLS